MGHKESDDIMNAGANPFATVTVSCAAKFCVHFI